jgi:hypothetical protein
MRLCWIHWWRCGVCFLVLALALTPAYHSLMAQRNSAAPKRDINTVLAAHDRELLAIPGVVGVYVGTLADRRTLCLKVMLARDDPEAKRKIPTVIEGYPVITEVTGEIRALEKP